MKTQVFSEERLKELVEKGETTTVGPVKSLVTIGEVVQATNEKGKKTCVDCMSNGFGYHCTEFNPLLVVLKKIEKETYAGKPKQKFWFETWGIYNG